MSEEGKETDEAIKVFVSEKEGNTPDLFGERIMKSVGSPEEEVMLNTPVHAPYIINSSSSSLTFFPQILNLAAKEAK